MNYVTIWELGWGGKVGREERRWREADKKKREGKEKL